MPSPLGVLVPSKRNAVLGHLLLWFRAPVGSGVPWGPPPHPFPAVHRHICTALHYAAFYGNRRIVRQLLDANADIDAQNRDG